MGSRVLVRIGNSTEKGKFHFTHLQSTNESEREREEQKLRSMSFFNSTNSHYSS